MERSGEPGGVVELEHLAGLGRRVADDPGLAEVDRSRVANELAGWSSDHVRICAGGAQQCAFLPQLRGAPGNRRPYRDR